MSAEAPEGCVHRSKFQIGGRDNSWYPEYGDIPSRVYWTMSEQGSSTGLGSNIQIPTGKTFYIDTIIANNESAADDAQIIFTLTSTSSSPIFAVRVPKQDTVIITGLIGPHTSTSSVLWFQHGNTNVFSTGAMIGGWLVDSPDADHRTTTRVSKVH